MGKEGFFRRWARLKSDDSGQVPEPPAPAVPASTVPTSTVPASTVPAAPAIAPDLAGSPAPTGVVPARLPTLEDAARLTTESDYSTFVAQGVDKSVQRLAMKKLFSDPHFNVLDGLDIYMGDYNLASPVSATMLATLQHAESFFASAADVEAKALARLEAEGQAAAAASDASGGGAVDAAAEDSDGAGDADADADADEDGDGPAARSQSEQEGSAQLCSTQQANPDAVLEGLPPSIEGVE